MSYAWQQSQWQNVQQQLQADKLPHALLLTGPEGLGKLDFTRQLANSLLCCSRDNEGYACGECAACRLLAAGNHPDLYVLQAEERGKAIKVDEIRQLSARLNLTSQYGGYQVAIIVDAHDMNINAANSLLKTLEEPSGGAVLLLVSSNPQKLPITVRSRCQLIHFTLPDRQQALSWLQQNNEQLSASPSPGKSPGQKSGATPEPGPKPGPMHGIEQLTDLLNLAHGAPLLALQLQQSDLLTQHQQLISALLALAKNQPMVEQAEQLHKLPLSYLLNWLYDWIQDLIKLHQCGDNADLVHERHKSELIKLRARTSLNGLYEYLDQLSKQIQLLSMPLNTQLLWEDLLLSWNKLLK